jgi:site-specific DNA-methyltransferase (adenine-specific)
MTQANLFAPDAPFSPSILHQGDAFDWLKSLPAESLDLVVTDFPYESLELHRSKGTTTRLKVSEGSSNEWFPVIKNERLPELMSLIYRALKPNRHLYLFVDEPTADVIKAQQFQVILGDSDGAEVNLKRNSDGSFPCASGFKFWKSMVWVKSTNDRSKPYGGTGYHYRAAKEFVLFFEKGKRKLSDLGLTDVFLEPRTADGYPTEKPYGVVEALVTNSTLPGELVADPFSGSHVTGHAALATGRRAACNDIGTDSLSCGRRRLAQWLPAIGTAP